MKYRRHSGGIAARLGMALLASSALIGVTTAALVVGSSSPAEAAASCTFDGSTTIVTGVTPGAGITINCTGLPTKVQLLGVETSALAGLVSSNNQTAEADVGALQGFNTGASGTIVNKSFNVPSPFVDGDPNGVCPPTQAQIDAGEVGCLLSLANPSTEVSYGTVTLDLLRPAESPGTGPHAQSLERRHRPAGDDHRWRRLVGERGSGDAAQRDQRLHRRRHRPPMPRRPSAKPPTTSAVRSSRRPSAGASWSRVEWPPVARRSPWPSPTPRAFPEPPQPSRGRHH